MRNLLGAVLAIAAGCGKIGFVPEHKLTDAAEPDDGESIDAAPPAGFRPPIHHYRLASSLDDDVGSIPLTDLGGGFVNNSYQFAVNKGLALSNALPVSTYTIDIKFSFTDINGYRKLIDFKELMTDEGLYVHNEVLEHVVNVQSTPPLVFPSNPLFSAGTPFQVTLTRDAAGAVTNYVNRSPAIHFVDDTMVATFSRSAAHIGNFAVDDNATGQLEASAGTIFELTVWDVALTAQEIATLP